MTFLNHKTTVRGRLSLGAAASCLLALAITGPAQAAGISGFTAGSDPLGPSIDGTAGAGILDFNFVLLDTETPVSFDVDLAPGEILDGVSIQIFPPNGSVQGTFSPIEDLAISFSAEADLLGSTTNSWSAMLDANRGGVAPSVDAANFASSFIPLKFVDEGLSTQRVDIDSAFAPDFFIGGNDFTLTFDPGDIGVAAVPLPAAVWLFASGLAGVAAVGRRKKKKT